VRTHRESHGPIHANNTKATRYEYGVAAATQHQMRESVEEVTLFSEKETLFVSQ
jgi:hypothetical protein